MHILVSSVNRYFEDPFSGWFQITLRCTTLRGFNSRGLEIPPSMLPQSWPHLLAAYICFQKPIRTFAYHIPQITVQNSSTKLSSISLPPANGFHKTSCPLHADAPIPTPCMPWTTCPDTIEENMLSYFLDY